MEKTSPRSKRFAVLATLAAIALCVVAVAGYRLHRRMDIVEGEVAYATERISALEQQVSELSDRVDDLESGEDEAEDPVDAVAARFARR